MAGILNISANHLDRHRTMSAYVTCKSRILNGQSKGNRAVLGCDDPGAWSLRSRVIGDCWGFSTSPNPAFDNGCYLSDEWITIRKNSVEDVVVRKSDINIPGQHNVLNVLAACALAGAADVEVAAMRQAIREFEGLPHRIELVRENMGVRWINDSVATAPERTLAAISSFSDPIVLLLGGRDKHLPWGKLAKVVKRRVKYVILFGEAAELIERNLLKPNDQQDISVADASADEAVISTTFQMDKGPGVKSGYEGSPVGETEISGPYPPTIVISDGLDDAVQLASQVAQHGESQNADTQSRRVVPPAIQVSGRTLGNTRPNC